MESQAIRSVDDWLLTADEVLAQAREYALSPSSTQAPDSIERTWEVSMATFSLGLEDLLDRLSRRPGRWILIAEDVERSHIYWQALSFEDGSIIAEATSATYGGPDECHSPEVLDLLGELGWVSPNPPDHPNWWRSEPTFYPDIADIADQAVRTLQDAFAMPLSGRIRLRLFPSDNRGATPASEVVDRSHGDEMDGE